MHATRRQSSAVYRRRRLAVLVSLLVVIGLVAAAVWALTRPSGDGGSAPKPSVSQTSAGADADPSIDPSADPSTEPSPEPTGVQECVPANLTLTAQTDKGEYAAGEEPAMTMQLTNHGAVDCIFNVGTTVQTFAVSSGQDVWWRSTDCQADPADAIVTLAAGATISSSGPVIWNRSRSSADTCDDENRPRAPGGGASYHLSVSIGDVQSENTVQFILY